MALTVGIPLGAATNASLVTADMQRNGSVIDNVYFDENIRSLQVEKVNEIRGKAFLRGLEKSWKTPGEEFVLKSFLQRILKMSDTPENRGLAAKMQGAFFKQQGYLARMFSNETWKEWTENQTELGQVVFELKNCLESQTRVRNCVNKLDQNVLEKANEQAKIALTPKPLGMPESLGLQTSHSCLRGILGGAVGSLAIEHPAPLLLGLSECLPTVSAQQPVGGEFQVNTYTASEQGLSSAAGLSNGNFVVTWISDGQDGDSWGVYGQLYDGSGTKIGSEFQVNTYTASSQFASSAAGLSNGNFVVTWDSAGQDGDLRGVYGQLYDGSGTKIGSEFQVNTYTVSSQGSPSASGLSNGTFVVTWESNGQDGSMRGVYGQLYDSSGTKIGSEFQVNTYTASNQWLPSAAGLSNGNFVVTWDSAGQNGSSRGVYGQLYDGSGTKIGNEFQVNTYTAGFQVSPSAAGISNGNFVVTWDSDGQDGDGSGVYGQIFNSNVLVPTGSTSSTTTAAGTTGTTGPGGTTASAPTTGRELTTVGTTQAGTGVVSSSSRLQGGLLGSALGLARKSFGDFIATHWPMGKARIK